MTSLRLEWLRQLFADHPVVVIATILMAVAILAFTVVGGVWMASRRGQS